MVIKVEFESTGVTNSSQYVKDGKYDLEALLKSRHVFNRILDLKQSQDDNFDFELGRCFSEIYAYVKVAREAEGKKAIISKKD